MTLLAIRKKAIVRSQLSRLTILYSWDLHYKMSCSSQSLSGASSTFAFFFSEKFLRQHFQEVELDQGDPQPGDLYVFQLRSSRAQWFGAHVGVYCGHGEIIHFEGRTSRGGRLQMLVQYCDGMVHKEGLYAMRRSRRLLRVLRKLDGIDPKVLEQHVQRAMSSDPPRYHPIRSNCVHFALGLLGMDSTLVGSSCTFKFFPEESMRPHFQEVKLDQGDPQPGDLYMFQLQSSRAERCGAHVGVYCGHGEIIHFEGSTSRSGVVSKQSLSDMKRYGGQLLHVFRKCSGVDPGVLGHSVQRAMSSDPPRYHPRSSNCVHFALDLLSMD
ncbi:uncharacterized protein LOC101828386 isoform X2 [Mesocricetus auratus]|uniref:Uncharacterized protein LOC101828386 isoform X2 n=1 Tax=Mesocricetus auratus TaxID=10036 RepID=A0ABM2W3Q1_MESAU|nr:uncharacterized protein LOC101828386 isoform X2 [Mesocricetus auratus]